MVVNESSNSSTVNLNPINIKDSQESGNRATLSWNIPEYNKTSYGLRIGIETKRILTDIWGELKSGELLAVMGPSGMIDSLLLFSFTSLLSSLTSIFLVLPSLFDLSSFLLFFLWGELK